MKIVSLHSPRQRKITWLVIGIVLILAATVCVIHFSRIENRFPQWKPAEEQPAVPGVTGELLEIDPDAADVTEQIDTVRIAWQLERQTSFSIFDWWIDYLYDGQWYTIYEPGQPRMRTLAAHFHDPGTHEMDYSVPKGALYTPGSYRLYMEGYGYCSFEVAE